MSTEVQAPTGMLKPRVSSKSHPKVTHEDILAFFQQLSVMFRAGTPIYEAIQIAATQCQSIKLQDVVEKVAARVASGSALNAALATYPDLFKVEWIEIVKSGEESGQLGKVLDKLVEQIDRQAQLRSKMVSAAMYPSIVLCVAIVAVSVMLVKVVPTFANMFASMGKKLPAITEDVLAVSNFLQERGLTILIVLGITIFFLRRFLKTVEGRRTKDRIFTAMPLIGDVVVQANMQKFASNAALLLRAGLPLLEAIKSMQGILATNSVYGEAMQTVAKHVERGGNLSEGMEKSGAFTTFVISMARIGEGSGTLPEVLDEVETFYRRKVEVVVERLTGTMETVVILFMGITVAVILCAVYLPMFSAASGVS